VTDTAVIFDIIGRDRTSDAIASSGSAFNKLAIGIAASAAFVGVKLVDMAANFQQSMTRLTTGAGESQKNMAMVSSGILDLAGKVGESTKDLAAGMYLVESAGFHGADGLKVLEIAAMGAKVGNADMATVADAVTTALNAYHLSANDAAAATNALIAAEGQGKTNLEALSASLSTVAPIASLAHVSLNELLAAMATMTGQGTDAASAATYLKQTIGQLSNPTAKAQLEMKALGLNAIDVEKNLGKNGLASTLTMLTDAIQKKMGPAGTVLIQQLQKAAGNTTEFQKVLANLPPTQQTFIGALATMTGGTKSMQAALELTGSNMATFQNNIDVINGKVAKGGSTIEGWSDVQQNFNQRMAEAKGTVEALGIRIGTALLPSAQKALNVTMQGVTWLTKHKEVARDAAIVIGVLAGAFVAYRLAVVVVEAATKAWMVVTKLATAAQWLLSLAMDVSPIGLIIIAVVALVAAFVYLWTHSAGFRNFFIGMWNDIWKFMKAVGAWFAGPFAHFFVKAGKDIAAPFIWVWNVILYPIFKFWMAVIKTVMQIVNSLAHLWWDIASTVFLPVWNNILKPIFNAWGAIAVWLWDKVLKPYLGFVVEEFKFLGQQAMWLWNNAIQPAVKGIGDLAVWLWDKAIKPAWNLIVGQAEAVGKAFMNMFNGTANFIGKAFTEVNTVIKNNINFLIGMLDNMINFLNNDVIGTANKLPGVNFPKIPLVPKLASGGSIARGGLAVVGERGPELVTLPTGANVYPNGTGPAGSGSGGTTVTFAGNTDSAFAEFFKKLVRRGLIKFS
jgi:TP901 family phage tail tape measure protein